MAVASAVGNRGDFALAKNSEFRVCRRRNAPRPRAVGFGLARRTGDDARGTASIMPDGLRAAFRCRAQAPWPRHSPLALESTAIALPVPAQSIFEIQEDPRATAPAVAPASHRAEQTVPAERETDGVTRLISADAGDSAAHRSPEARRLYEPEPAARTDRSALTPSIQTRSERSARRLNSSRSLKCIAARPKRETAGRYTTSFRRPGADSPTSLTICLRDGRCRRALAGEPARRRASSSSRSMRWKK